MFISFEGGEGVGKSTQIDLLAAVLEDRGIPICLTREPGGTPFGEALRTLFLEHPMDPHEEFMMLLAARYRHVRYVIQPALERGEWVLCDRYIDSSLVYQGMHIQREDLVRWHKEMGVCLWPDLTFILEDDPRRCLSRKKKEDCNRFEGQPLAFHQKVQEGYREVARLYPQRCVLIDVSTPLETSLEIQKTLWSKPKSGSKKCLDQKTV